MPQMSPLMWGNLFILFMILLLISAVKIYFSSSDKNSTTSSPQSPGHTTLTPLNWTW